MFILPYVIFDIPAGYLADRYGKTKILMLGLTIAGVFLIIFGYSTTKLMFLASAFIATMGLSFARPSVEGLLTDLVEKKQKGGIVGIWNSSEDLGYILGPFIGGVIAESYGDITIPFILLGAAMLVLVAVSIPVFLISQRKSVTS
jgi:MFS family permease